MFLSDRLAQDILNYLVTKPYNEVSAMINSIVNESKFNQPKPEAVKPAKEKEQKNDNEEKITPENKESGKAYRK